MARLLFHLMAGVIDLGVGALVVNATMTVWSVFAFFNDGKKGPFIECGFFAAIIAPLVSMYLTHSFLLAYAL